MNKLKIKIIRTLVDLWEIDPFIEVLKEDYGLFIVDNCWKEEHILDKIEPYKIEEYLRKYIWDDTY